MVLIDIVLSGDNAVVIGMAAAPLREGQRRTAVLLGGGLAVLLRITLTWLALQLLQIPAVGLIGGPLLLWIAFKLLKQEEEASEGVRQAATMRGAIATIMLADLIMSLDNVLGVAAAARGTVAIAVFGLVLSMAIVIGAGGVLAGVISRFTWLAYIGSAVIAWTGAQMTVSDPWLAEAFGDRPELQAIISAVVTVVVVVLAHYLHRHRPARTRERLAPHS